MRSQTQQLLTACDMLFDVVEMNGLGLVCTPNMFEQRTYLESLYLLDHVIDEKVLSAVM